MAEGADLNVQIEQLLTYFLNIFWQVAIIVAVSTGFLFCFSKKKGKKSKGAKAGKEAGTTNADTSTTESKDPTADLRTSQDTGESVEVKERRTDESDATHTSSKTNELKPLVFSKNEKQQRISRGLEVRKRTDYPTMEDVISDWGEPGEPTPKKAKSTSTILEATVMSAAGENPKAAEEADGAKSKKVILVDLDL